MLLQWSIKTCNAKIMPNWNDTRGQMSVVTAHLSSSFNAQEHSREPAVAKIDVAKLMSFYDFLNTAEPTYVLQAHRSEAER